MSFTKATREEQDETKDNHVNGNVSLVRTLRSQVRLAAADACRRRCLLLCCITVETCETLNSPLLGLSERGVSVGVVQVGRWNGSAAYQPLFVSVNVTWLQSAEDDSPPAVMFTEPASVRRRGKPFLV